MTVCARCFKVVSPSERASEGESDKKEETRYFWTIYRFSSVVVRCPILFRVKRSGSVLGRESESKDKNERAREKENVRTLRDLSPSYFIQVKQD